MRKKEAQAISKKRSKRKSRMIVFLDTNNDLAECEVEIGRSVGQLITPLTRFQNQGRKFAIDNGAFAGFKPDGFRSLIKRELLNKYLCTFVCAPDVVGSARRTLECFKPWFSELNGWPIALVAQDGIEDLEIPWSLISAIFIGGSTEFKLSKSTVHIIRAAQALEKWVHVGRVNTPIRFEKFEELGVDSIDGSGISRYSHMRENLASGSPLLAQIDTDF